MSKVGEIGPREQIAKQPDLYKGMSRKWLVRLLSVALMEWEGCLDEDLHVAETAAHKTYEDAIIALSEQGGNIVSEDEAITTFFRQARTESFDEAEHDEWSSKEATAKREARKARIMAVEEGLGVEEHLRRYRT